jgi:Rod binding domain-containing protein
MFEGIKPEAPFGGGNSEAMWRSMQIEEYGKAITKAGGIGIADSVYREIIKLQEIN